MHQASSRPRGLRPLTKIVIVVLSLVVFATPTLTAGQPITGLPFTGLPFTGLPFGSSASATNLVSDGATVTASSTWQKFVPENVISESAPNWNSGKYATPAPQWILLTLKEPSDISAIRLQVSQDPAGPAVHDVFVGKTLQTLALAQQFTTVTHNGDELLVMFASVVRGVRYVKVVTTSSTGWVAWNKITIYGSTVPDHLKYFGYEWVNDVDQLQQHKTWVDYLPEIQTLGNSNVVQVDLGTFGSQAPLSPQFLSFLKAVQDSHYQAIVGVGGTLLADPNPDLEQELNALEALKPYQSAIYAFYFDEPFLFDQSPKRIATFQAVTNRLRSLFPGVGLMAILSVPEVQTLPSTALDTLTDVGFDDYFWYPNSLRYTELYTVLESKAKRGQNMWLVPDGFLQHGQPPQDLTEAFNFYYLFAQSHARVAGLLPFLYSPSGGLQCSVRSAFTPGNACYSASLKEAMVRAGRQIVTRNY